MLRLMAALGSCILAGALVLTASAHAATYYVATTGSDSHPGTEEKPWRTVAYAVSQMVAGDTTYVRSGTYVTGTIWFGRSGSQSSPIKLLNYHGEKPVIDCVDSSKDYKALHLQNSGGLNLPIGWITIEGFEIKRCWFGIRGYNLHDSVIRRNWIHDSAHSGVLMNGSARLVIDRNIVQHNGWPDEVRPGGHGLYINGSSHIVTNNLFINNRGHGIQQNGNMVYDTSKHAGPEFAYSDNWIVANNTMAYSGWDAGMVIWGKHCNNTRIENNIFYENASDSHTSEANGINWVACCSTGIQIRNNLVYASGSGGMLFMTKNAVEGVTYTQSGNIVNTSNPEFVNAPATLPPSPNFALTKNSPAIDKGLSPEQSPDIGKGLPLSWTKIDFTGTSRPKGSAYDIGAYEFNKDGDSKAPFPVQDVQVD